MHYEAIDYNNEERLRGRVEWQKFLELSGNMADVSTCIWHVDLKGLVEGKDANKFI